MVHFQCNIHPWMDAWVLVFNHPYAAVTDDDGNFRSRTCRPVPRCGSRPGTKRGRTTTILTPNKIKGDEMELKDGETITTSTL